MFNRPPRIQKTKQAYQIKIPSPDSIPSKPKLNWVSFTLPLIGTGLAIGLMAFVSERSVESYLMFLPLMLASVLAGVINQVMRQKEYKKELLESRQAYAAVLDEVEQELITLHQQQYATLNQNDPAIAKCIKLAETQDTCVGERRPGDDDFLSFRLGLAKQPSGINIENLKNNKADKNIEDLVARANGFSNRFTSYNAIPVTVDLLHHQFLGIAGEDRQTANLCRAAAIHLATHHWPAEIDLIVFCQQGRKLEWEWISSLPHQTHLFNSLNIVKPFEVGASDPAILALEKEISRRQTLQDDRKRVYSDKKTMPVIPALVIILDHVPDIYEYPAFSLLLKSDPSLGLFGIFVTNQIDELPNECGAMAEFRNTKLLLSEMDLPAKQTHDIDADQASRAEALKFTQFISKIDYLVPEDVTEPPEKLSLLDMFAPTSLEELPIERWWDGDWDNDSRLGYLRTPLGKLSPMQGLIFDLNEGDQSMGPHGIIGGTTGSGKSEFLKTLVLSYALTHSPYEINFALIDFKGGAAFNELEKLPHIVGIMTDIENHADYAERVIQSLTGEINNRKQVFEEARKKAGLARLHIDNYRALLVKRPLPRLVIIFDEFAEFKDKHPEESQKLISIARVGRSLGIHLILCTQNPATAVDQQVSQNSKFRICLRVNSPEDSKSLIGIPDAWGLAIGQAYIRIQQPQKFRAAYTGSAMKLDRIKQQTVETHTQTNLFEKVTESQAIVKRVTALSDALGLIHPPKVWAEPLPERLYLPDLYEKALYPISWNGHGWQEQHFEDTGVLVGLYDDPLHQKQPIFTASQSGGSGHMLVFGSSGSGKSTFLTTFALSLAMTASPDQVNIYCLDFGKQNSLEILKDLPHLARVGGVISENEGERANRLLAMIRFEISHRIGLFQAQRVKGINSYNASVSKSEQLPLVYVLIDSLNKQFTQDNPGFSEQLEEIIRSGRSAGFHIIITANLTRDIPSTLLTDVGEKIVLLHGHNVETSSIFGLQSKGLAKKLEMEQISPGRAIINRFPVLEVQVALPVSGVDELIQNMNLINMIELMAESWTKDRPKDIEILPRFISARASLLTDKTHHSNKNSFDIQVPLGIGNNSLEPISLSINRDGPYYLIASSDSKLGKTTFIKTWLLSLAQFYSPETLQFVLVDYHSRSLRQLANLPHVSKYIAKKQDMQLALEYLEKIVRERESALENEYSLNPEEFDEEAFIRELGYVVIVIDDFETFKSKSPQDPRLGTCIQNGETLGLRIILAENAAMISPGADNILKRATRFGCGVLLGGSDFLSLYNNVKVPYGQKTYNLPAGRGYLINRGQVQLFQSFTYWKSPADDEKDRGEQIKQWIEKIKKDS